ncbi:MAG: hypothetical protein EOO77_14740, partial [Oxalobacteraceae bacterium]
MTKKSTASLARRRAPYNATTYTFDADAETAFSFRENPLAPNAGDENGLYTLTKAEEDRQTAYLDSLPKHEQVRLAAKACGTELHRRIANGQRRDVERDAAADRVRMQAHDVALLGAPGQFGLHAGPGHRAVAQ